MKMTLDKSLWLKIAAGALLAIGLVFFITGIMTAKRETTKVIPQMQPERLYQAWVLTHGAEKGTIITTDLIEPVSTPQFNDSFIQNPDIAIGRRLKEEVAPGTYLTAKLLAPNRPVIDDLPEDYRAIAIKAGEVLTVGGYLQPGDFVDVMLLLKPNKESGAMTSARTIASNLMVLAIGENQTSKDDFQREDHAKSVVLAVHESIAPILLLADASGEIRLAAVGSKEVALSNRPDSSFAENNALFHTVAVSQTTSSSALNRGANVVELKQFNLTPKKSPKVKPAPKRPSQPVSYVEVIQGNERSMVTTKN